MEVQVVTADDKIEANRGRIALRYGPLVYNVERADNKDLSITVDSKAKFTPQWRSDMFNGIITINGKWHDGTALLAIPHYLRMNRLPTPPPAASGTTSSGSGTTQAEPRIRQPESVVWISFK